MISAVLSKFGILFLKAASRLPFPVFYWLADVFFFLIYHVFDYRKDIVLTNLKNAFPDKTDSEIKLIRKKFYRHLADHIMETFKMHGMTKKDYEKRYVVKNPELLNNYYNSGKSVVILTSHFNNWEWGNWFPRVLKHTILGVYKPLHNKYFDEFLKETRGRFGAEMVPDSKILRRVIHAENNQEKVFTWLAGDQTPPPSGKFWFRFLNQDTIFFHGPAFFSRKFNHPVFFQETKKVGRGKYEVTFELLFDQPAKHTDNEIIRAFIKKMEAIIDTQPECYLWSHRRWKHKKPAGAELIE